MDTDTLQGTLYNLAESGTLSNPAYNTLLHDYARYHAVLIIEGGIFTLILVALSVYFWRRFISTQEIEFRKWSFEKKTYFSFGLAGAVITLFMFLIVTANLSNAINPQDGFIKSIPDLNTPQTGTQKALLYQAVNIWAKSGSDQMPLILQNEVNNRLSWQQPKAVICSIFLVIFAIFTMRLWQHLIKISKINHSVWVRKEKALFVLGMISAPITLLLMLMSLANTQASFAPIMLTLLFG